MFFSKNNLTIYYEKHGNKPTTILILPGWGNTRKTFNYLINYLKEYYTIYIIAYPGFGNSPIPKHDLTIYDYTNIIYKFIKQKKINPIIIAHSFGGRITSILISKYKLQITKLILIDVAGIKRFNLKIFIKQKIYKLLKCLIKFIPSTKKLIYKEKLLNMFSSTDYQNIPVIMRDTFKNIINEDLKNYYKLITCPTLIIWGEKDTSTPLKDAYYLRKVIKNSELIIYDNGSHFPYLDKIFITNKIIEEYLKEKKT